MNDKIQYNASKFELSNTIASSAAGYMEQAKASAGAVKSTVPSDFSLSSSAISSANEIETVCSKSGFLTSTFNYWKNLLSILDDNENSVPTDSNIKAFYEHFMEKYKTHVGAYETLFGVPLLLGNLVPGYNYIPAPGLSGYGDAGNKIGGYVIWIPKNYNPSVPVAMSVIFHASDLGSTIETQELADLIHSEKYEPNSIVLFPCAAGIAYDVPAGSLSFPHPKIQAEVLETMEALMMTYNVDMSNISVTGLSSGIRGALEFARNNPDYISDVYTFDHLGLYDYTTGYDNGKKRIYHDEHTHELAIQNVKDLSDLGVKVTIYSCYDYEGMYNGYDNVNLVKVPANHDTIVPVVWETTDYLDRIGGFKVSNEPTFSSFEMLGKIKTPTPTATPTPTVVPTATPKPTPTPEGVNVTQNGIGVGVSPTMPTPTPTPKATPTAPPVTTPTATPTATPTTTSNPTPNSYNELREELFDLKNKKPEKVEEEPKDPVEELPTDPVEEEPEKPTTPPAKDDPKEPSTPPAEPTAPEPTYILPENKFSELIPNLTSGTLDSMEITATTANYELSGITDAIYNDYINSLKTAGYTLGADGSWINGNYILNLVRNNTDLNIYFKMTQII